LPTDVEAIAARPVWELTDSEELRSKQVEVDFGPVEASSRTPVRSGMRTDTQDETIVRATSASRLTRLLDRPPDDLLGHLGLGLFAVAIGMLHGIQPGHGKMLAVAGSVGSTRPRRTALILASSASTAHLGLVVMVAVGLAATGSTDHALVQRSLLTFTGFTIAVTGAWRLGRLLRGDSTSSDGGIVGEPSAGGLVRLGLAAGALPCWEAIAVFAIAAAVGRPWLGCMLVACFSLGLGLVVMLFAELGGRIASASRWKSRGAIPWIHLAGAAALLVIGCSLLFG
jgi:ABC-type nickel/cobalt efflux system permease component RcnA